MFVAHVPVGLALARIIMRQTLSVKIMAVAALGTICPDLDLIRFYIFDNHQRHHHDYWTHIPAVWALIILGWFALCKFIKRPFGILPTVFFAAALSHLVLDSVAGEIQWLWPFSDKGFHLVTVPATQAKWYLSFLTHWTFGVETLLSAMALFVAFRRKS
ncbi:metal-dependent hydrolase [Hellea sp.]|nr:metal-dependent hydrolase [Hellea sp.]